MEGKRLWARWDILVLAGALALAAALFFWQRAMPKGVTAVIERDGEAVLAQELGALAGPRKVAVDGAGGCQVTVELSPEGARVVSSGCPDQVCVRTGWVTRAGEAALCLPARVALRLEGAGGSIDAVTY